MAKKKIAATTSKKATTIRASPTAKRLDKTRSGPAAKAGKTKSILEVAGKVSHKKATTIRAGAGPAKKQRLRGGATTIRANSSASSISH